MRTKDDNDKLLTYRIREKQKVMILESNERRRVERPQVSRNRKKINANKMAEEMDIDVEDESVSFSLTKIIKSVLKFCFKYMWQLFEFRFCVCRRLTLAEPDQEASLRGIPARGRGRPPKAGVHQGQGLHPGFHQGTNLESEMRRFVVL